MFLAEELRYEISRSINTLRRRSAATADNKERKDLATAIQDLNDKLDILDQADLLNTALVLTDASQTLEKAVGAARTGPFDGYLSALEGHLDRLNRLSGAMHGQEALPPAPEEGAEAEAATATRGIRRRDLARAVRGLPPGLMPPNPVKDYASLKNEYQAWYDACQVRPGNEGNVAYYVKRLKRGNPTTSWWGRTFRYPGPSSA